MPEADIFNRLSQIDLHFHCGLERPGEYTLRDYVQHAFDTGRRYQGLTDHAELFMRPRNWSLNTSYPRTLAGFWRFRREMDALQADFPQMRLFFAPEYAVESTPDVVSDAWFEAADVCLFELLYESWQEHSLEERTAVAVHFLERIGATARRIGKPCYWVHPLRGIITRRIGDGDPPAIHPQVLEILSGANGHIPADDLNRLFQFDLQSLGKAAAGANVPLEINGMTQARLAGKLPAAVSAYRQAYRLMLEQGARFVPGTDQHQLWEYSRVKGWTAPFAWLGVESIDRAFLARLGIEF